MEMMAGRDGEVRVEEGEVLARVERRGGSSVGRR